MRKDFCFKSASNVTDIHAVEWTSNNQVDKPKAIVQISHGMAEHILRYDDFANFLNKNNIYVCGNDHLGHGKSVQTAKDHGYFCPENGHKYVVDDLYKLNKITRKKYPGVPYYLFGHSMGSFLAREYAMRYGNSIDGAIVMGTGQQAKALLKFVKFMCAKIANRKGWDHRSPFIYKLAFSSYNKRIKDNDSEFAWLSRDNQVIDRYNSDEMCGFMFTLNGLYNLFDLLEYIGDKENIKKIPKDLRLLLLAGVEDPVGSYAKAVILVRDALKDAGIKNVDMKLYEGARHELLNELNKQEVYDDVLGWILK